MGLDQVAHLAISFLDGKLMAVTGSVHLKKQLALILNCPFLWGLAKSKSPAASSCS